MTYPKDFEAKLGFTKIRALVREATLCRLGAERTEAMAFSTDEAEVCRRLAVAAEMMAVMDAPSPMPADNFLDPTPALRRLRLAGTSLSVEELHDVRRSLAALAAVVGYLRIADDDGRRPWPLLRRRAEAVETCPDVLRAAERVLTAEGDVRDTASAALADIRRQIRVAEGSLSRLLGDVLRAAQSEGVVEAGVSPVLRDGRLVIPVLAAHKRHLRGVVHDASATGRTLYIEPAEVVEANNRIRALEGEERQEIARILLAVADEIRPWLESLLDAYDFLGEVDFLRAVAIFARRIGGTVPTVDAARHETEWLSARHPLLLLRYKAEGKEAAIVPLDVAIDDSSRRIVLISGPNAGGKSVCLETLGLLQYMTQCGLPVPVAQGSLCTIYDHIFIDIGDAQSIDDDLSTYSSHLANMRYFLRHAGRRTLLLIDEFGSGTEPQMGGALAQAVLGRFVEAGAHGVITTHYQNLKQYASSTPGVINAAMQFDRREMRPLFRLEVGQPGSSFAIETARRVGLPAAVIDEAKRIVGEDYVDMDKYLQSIARDKLHWERKRQEVDRRMHELDERSAALDAQMTDLRSRRTAILQSARDEAASLLADANARIEGTIRRIKEAQAERDATRVARRDLAAYRDSLQATPADTARPAADGGVNGGAASVGEGRAAFRPGDAVCLDGQNTVGRVLVASGSECVVAFGMMKTTVATSRLRAARHADLRTPQPYADLRRADISPATADAMRERRLHFRQELDLRGLRADEAMQALAYYIDDAVLVGAGRVRILHGTGTGALRQATRQYLAVRPGVAAYRDEHPQFGGAGVTVVELE